MIKKIPGYGGAYGVDEEGHVYSYYLRGSHDSRLQETPQKLAPYCGANNDYLMVGLSLEGKTRNLLVHRLVAETFLKNPNNLAEVDHLNKIVTDNRVENLEWVDRKENLARADIDYGGINGLRTGTRLFNNKNELLGTFPSITAACKYATQFGCSESGMKKNKITRNGYYIIPDENPNLKKASERSKATTWELFSPEGEYIDEFPSIRQAGLYIKNNIRDISVKLFQTHKKAYGYYVVEKRCRD